MWSLVAVVVLVELLHADVRYAGAVHLQLDAVAPENGITRRSRQTQIRKPFQKHDRPFRWYCL